MKLCWPLCLNCWSYGSCHFAKFFCLPLSFSVCFYCAVLCYGSNSINWLIFWQEKEPIEEDEAVNISISHVSTGIPLLLVCFQCLLGAWFPLICFTFIKIFYRIQAKIMLEGFMMIWRYGDSVRVVCLFIYIFLDLDKSRTYFP